MARTVLLCDDEVHIMRAIEVRLRGANYDVLLSSDGEEAWELIERKVPDLLITDVAMPRLDGFELCQRIRAHQQARELPIFFLTARGGDFDHAEVKQKWGILDILAKPFSPRDVLRRVDSVFAVAAAPALGCNAHP
jgi:two-component system alkaline phosphatase synthesis response regulator PhoP